MSHILCGKLELLATGFQFTEGSVWDGRNRCLFFCDEVGDKILRWSPSGGVVTFREPSGNADGLTFDKDGNLIICEYGNHRVSMIDREGKYRVLVDRFQGKRLNKPNDVVVKSDGTIYFTDSGHGVQAGDCELPGVYRYHPTNGELDLLVDDFEFPNGLAFSPDESRLYISDSKRSHIRVFEVDEDGGISGGRVFAKVRHDEHAPPDGMKVDVRGNLYVAASGGIWVFSQNGKSLGVIPIPEAPANLAWGDADWRTLYITASTGSRDILTRVTF